MNRPLQVCLLVVLALLCFGAGAWYSSSRTVHTTAASARRVLYYHDPMHPAYRSPKPGIAPDCGMELEPVYEESAPNAPAGAPPGAIRSTRRSRSRKDYSRSSIGPSSKGSSRTS